MRTVLVVRSLALLALLGGALAPRTGQAANDQYDPFSGYGTHSARVGLTGGLLTGALATPGGGSDLYGQKSLNAEFNALTFFEPTVFGTLMGLEFDAALGIRSVDKPAAVADPENTTEGVGPTFKMDFEFTYDLVRWKLLKLRQRIILNAGGGFDYNSHPWALLSGESGWRAYPLIGGHVQTSVGDSVFLDVSYRLVPTQSKDGVGLEHRVGVGVGIKRIVVGAHLNTVRVLDTGSGPLDQTQVGVSLFWTL